MKQKQNNNGPPDEDVQELVTEYDLDTDTAESVRDIMDEYGLDEEEAIELEEAL
ncbi:MAG: hypothetical protein ABII02_02400 [Candidatus Magasanikbacteria bacterium]